MPTVTIRNVELVRTGTWNAGTGVETITGEDLDAILLAAADPEVDRAPVRIGHYDRRFDGEPALGWVENLRRVGDALVGDLVDVPARLAEVIPKAFRRRSVELGRRVRTPGGKLYRAALSGLALLGVQPPAVKGLADVLALYETPERAAAALSGVEVESSATVELVMGDVDDGVMAGIRATAAALSAAVEAGATTEEAANTILDAVYASAGVPDATITPADGAPGHNGGRDPHDDHGGTMPVDEARIRELLGIEQEADVEAELTNLIAQAQANGGEGGEGGNGDGSGEGEGNDNGGENDGEGGDASGELVGAGAPGAPGTVALSAGQYAELTRQAAAGAQAMATIEAQERASIIEQAQREGRISPAEASANFAEGGAWHGLTERPPAELRTFLSGLAPRFSTVELGAGTTGELPPGADPALDTFLADTFGVTLNGGQ